MFASDCSPAARVFYAEIRIKRQVFPVSALRKQKIRRSILILERLKSRMKIAGS
ncbi:hypothetical protein C1O63_0390 [Dehalococcoides mccartyi]|nr:hypothetical protein C1O63_0390 [Dehalococcoides mccartyi]